MLTPDTTAFLLVDVQGRLAEAMHGREALYDNLQRLVQGLQALEVPIVWVEQNPERLGPTVTPVANVLRDVEPVPKMSFSACGEPRVVEALARLGRKRVLVAGIETHVCVYQTVVHLLERGYEPHVVTDAVSSRTPANVELGLDRIRSASGILTGTEMCLFELLGDATHPAFKQILGLVK
jgi:nicotinamidase-related amidase